MTQYEFKALRFAPFGSDEEFEAQLNELGRGGWQVVGMASTPNRPWRILLQREVER